jgi:ABC-type Fe3+/spermidine/putrescine transport system ATPase subunit
MKTLEINDVSFSHSGVKALDALSLDIERGERIVILGPSGCGKTTILRLIAGFIAPDVGSISIAGDLVCRNGHILVPPEERNLGMVFQDLALWPHLSVEGNLDFGLRSRGMAKSERRQRIRTMLELVDLKAFSTRKPSELSGGQQQRVALARALVAEPTVLLMDEPLSSLDQDLNIRLRREVLRLHKDLGFTMVYVTHDQEEAADIATRIVTIDTGRIVGVASRPSEV